jgi:predicted Zn-dependent peptidase
MYHVGSKRKPERTGFATFFEHLLFEGKTLNVENGLK